MDNPPLDITLLTAPCDTLMLQAICACTRRQQRNSAYNKVLPDSLACGERLGREEVSPNPSTPAAK